MIDIKELKTGDVFYYVHLYHFCYKLEVVGKIYADGEFNICAKHLDNGLQSDTLDIIGHDEYEELFLTEEEAISHYSNCRQEELERLKDINNLLDELYSCATDTGQTEKEKILLEAINYFKAKNI